MINKILIIGASGMLGQPAARQLKEDGFQVRILARDVEKARKLFDESFEIVQGDVTDTTSLEKALAGCQGVHISVGGQVDQISAENTAALAAKSGLERISYISGATVSEQNRWFPMTEQKLMAEKAIRECGVPYTIFCATWPMEQLPRFARGGDKPSIIGNQPTPLHWYAAEDLGRLVSIAYQKPEAENKRFYVFGPEAIPMKAALERYCQAFYPDVEKVSVMPIWLGKLLGTLTRNDMLKFAVNLMAYFDQVGEMGEDPSEANQILGAPSITLDEWIEARKN